MNREQDPGANGHEPREYDEYYGGGRVEGQWRGGDWSAAGNTAPVGESGVAKGHAASQPKREREEAAAPETDEAEDEDEENAELASSSVTGPLASRT